MDRCRSSIHDPTGVVTDRAKDYECLTWAQNTSCGSGSHHSDIAVLWPCRNRGREEATDAEAEREYECEDLHECEAILLAAA